ncbi:hypothetical protein SDC9_123482 [bioreactor metagenome]|uniref:Bacteriophage abortive infection AbiH n=1 Tax=bioreactor metagenome TaxID=1076179 RepID=A0A645CHX6_9ZZZZ
MVFGYGDETDSIFSKIEDLDENELTKCMKSFHYVLNGNYRHLFDFLDSDNFNVYIMGHSCGLSDRVMFNKILQHPNMNEIKIFYHKKGNASHENDFFEKVQNISRYFDSNSKHLMRTKITPLSMSLPLTDL